jgi:hypothetical protein
MAATSPRLVAVARVWALTITGLQVIVPLLQERWAWGVWPAAYISLPWRLVLALVAAILILFGDRVWHSIGGSASQLLYRLNLSSPRSRLALALIAAVPFYLLRIRHLEWGDSELLVKALADPYRITYIWQAPLDVFIHARLWQLGNALFGWPDPTPVYNILSTLAGVAFIYILLSLARFFGRNRAERGLLVGLVATLGTMQLFFGYIENYPIMTVGVLLYAWLALRTLNGELSLVWPAATLAVTHAFHPSTLVLVPSLLYLMWQGNFARRAGVLRGDDTAAAGDTARTAKARLGSRLAAGSVSLLSNGASEHQPARLRGILSVAIPYAVVFAGVVALMEGGEHGLTALATVDFPGGGDRQWFVPLFEVTTEWQHYTMFSLGHLVDIVNQQLLVAPVVWPMVAAVAVLAWRRIPLRDTSFRFIFLMAGFYFALTLTWNADYGGQKDWDLFSPAAVPAALLLALMLSRVLQGDRALRETGWALISAQGFHTLLWVLRNTIA